MSGSGKYLRYRNVITVDSSNSYGFTLKMYAKNPDLVNSNDPNYVITSVSGHNRYLAANQWGYSMTGDSGTFNEIPSSSYNAAILADVTNDAKGVCDRVSYCGVPITFGANIEPKKSVSGYYSTTLTYTVTSKPAPDWNSICSNRYYGSDAEASDKRSYCAQHQGDMSGYRPDWSRICYDRYPGYDALPSGKRSYCINHGGDMSGYQPDWSSICIGKYPGDDMWSIDKYHYCMEHSGDMSSYQPNWGFICIERYPKSYQKYEREYCESHQGDMSGYSLYPYYPNPYHPTHPINPVHGGLD